jgi:hypothetical protein
MSRNNAQSSAAASTAVIIKQKIVQNGCGCGSGCGIFILILLGLTFWAMKSCVSDFTEARDRMQKPQQSPSVQTNTPVAKITTDSQITSKANETEKSHEDKHQLRATLAALTYAKPKLNDPESYTFKSCQRLQREDMNFYLIHYTGDAKNFRVGVKIADDGTTSIIEKSKLDTLLETETAQQPRETYEQLEDRMVEAVKNYVNPKLKNPKSFTLSEIEHRKHEAGDFYVVRFKADGRKLRVGVEVDALDKISIIDKSKLPALLESSKPAAK